MNRDAIMVGAMVQTATKKPVRVVPVNDSHVFLFGKQYVRLSDRAMSDSFNRKSPHFTVDSSINIIRDLLKRPKMDHAGEFDGMGETLVNVFGDD
jgi:hypothetical protein